MTDTNLRAAHPDQCTKSEDEDDDDSEGANSQTNEDNRDNGDDCLPKQYDLMKQQLLLKSMALFSKSIIHKI